MTTAAAWLDSHEEDHSGVAADLNQYWYSAATIGTFTDVLRAHCIPAPQPAARLDVAFVSTPSLYFALSASERASSRLLEFDATLGDGEPNFVPYDFRQPKALPEELRAAFGCVVIDPPFITSDVWQQYIETARWLLAPGGHSLLTTVIENAALLEQQLGATPRRYLPSIPNLPYQYAVFTDLAAPLLAVANAEVPHDPDEFLRAGASEEASKATLAAKAAKAAEAPLPGAGRAYDFEAMLEAELRRQETLGQQGGS